MCLEACATGSALCEDGQACAPANDPAASWVCLPGGDVGLGAACTRSLQCDRGGLCVSEGAVSVCRAACDPRVPVCAAGSFCMAWTSERGYCQSGVAPADMGISVDMSASPDLGASDLGVDAGSDMGASAQDAGADGSI